jgi:tetratricopeptide (TPR) repeat protein
VTTRPELVTYAKYPAVNWFSLYGLRNFLCAGLALGGLLAANIAASASDIPGYPDDMRAYDSRELAMLPRYCTYTPLFRDRVPGGNNMAEIKRWRELFGPTFDAMHHYCWGLMGTNRALLLARSKQLKAFYLGSSINEFDYVIDHAPVDFILLPEMLTKKGENLIRLGKGEVGVMELERAIELKPDYWPPYAALSDYYKDSGDVAKAREILQKAASFVPEAKGLKRRLVELDSVKAKPKRLQRAPSDHK